MITPFEAAHFVEMELRPSEAARLDADPGSRDKVLALAMYGHGITIWYKGAILGIVGYMEAWPGTFEVYAFPSVHVERYAVIYLRRVKWCIQSIVKSEIAHRLHTSCPADDVHNAWMTFLGFSCETPEGMKNYSVLNETFNMWSIITREACNGEHRGP